MFGISDPITLQLHIEKRIRSHGEAAITYLDRKMISNLNSRTSSGVLKELLSEGILKPSGKNWISLMTTSGAKGSMVSILLCPHPSTLAFHVLGYRSSSILHSVYVMSET